MLFFVAFSNLMFNLKSESNRNLFSYSLILSISIFELKPWPSVVISVFSFSKQIPVLELLFIPICLSVTPISFNIATTDCCLLLRDFDIISFAFSSKLFSPPISLSFSNINFKTLVLPLFIPKSLAFNPSSFFSSSNLW